MLSKARQWTKEKVNKAQVTEEPAEFRECLNELKFTSGTFKVKLLCSGPSRALALGCRFTTPTPLLCLLQRLSKYEKAVWALQPDAEV